ncbi:MAG: hypothetical protein ACLQVI_15880 [Polyangiaceae bacterium]|jgi:hypothetical protein
MTNNNSNSSATDKIQSTRLRLTKETVKGLRVRSSVRTGANEISEDSCVCISKQNQWGC